MRNRWIRRRFGWLFCVIGMCIMLGALSYGELARVHTVAAVQDAPRTLVIDAGHGGDDGGAVSSDGVLEAEINLAIAQRLDTLARLCGVQTVMTRASAEIDYPDSAQTTAQRKVADQKQRVARINATENAVLISIHQNLYPTPQPHGAQVLYGATANSAEFGEALHAQLVTLLDPQNRRVAAPISEDIYLMRNVTCPAVLVECGFLSNTEECARLQTNAYQTQLSLVMLASYLQYFQNGWIT